MSASARRTFDTDNIMLRTVYARGSNNTNIQSTLALTADGRGGTRWVHPSSLGTYSLNYISTDVSLIQWDLSLNNVFYLTGGQGVGIQSSATNSHQSIVYAKAYQALHDINTGSNMTPLDAWTPTTKYSTVYSTINLSTTSWMIYPTICSPTQTLYWNTNPIKFLVSRGVSTINTDYIVRSRPFSTFFSTCILNNNPLNTFVSSMYYTPSYTSSIYDEVNIDNVNSTIRFLGVRDLQLTTVLEPQRAVFFSISTFTSEGYLSLSGETAALRTLSTTMPYHYRSSLLLNASNAFLKQGPLFNYLSTPYTGTFTRSYVIKNGGPPIPTALENITSTIGFPYTSQGLRGTNIIATSNNVEIPGGSGKLYDINLTENANVYTGDAYISSLTFNMASYSTIIDRNNKTSITIDYTPNFLLSPNSTLGATAIANNAFSFSTFLNCADETVPGTVVEDLFYAPNQYPVQNPLYGRLKIEIPKNYITSHYTCTFTVNHYFPKMIAGYSNQNPNTWPAIAYLYTRAGLSSAQITSYTSKQNVAYITIIGT
jgi:hypothetical protein